MSKNTNETTAESPETKPVNATVRQSSVQHLPIRSRVRYLLDSKRVARFERHQAAYEASLAEMAELAARDQAVATANAEFDMTESKIREQQHAEDARLDEAQTAQLLKADTEIRAAQEALAAAEQAARDAATKVAEATNAQAKLENDYVNAGIMRVQRRHQEHEARAKAQQAKLRQITRGEADLSK